MKGFEDLEQARFAGEVRLVIDQDLARGFRSEKVVDATKQDAQSRDVAKAALELGGGAERVFLDVAEQRQAEWGSADRRGDGVGV